MAKSKQLLYRAEVDGKVLELLYNGKGTYELVLSHTIESTGKARKLAMSLYDPTYSNPITKATP